MIIAYRLISIILYPLLIIFIIIRKLIGKEDEIRFKEKIFLSSFDINRDYKKKLIWFHAASVGEAESIFPIIKQLNLSEKNLQILITTVTLSSGKLVEKSLVESENIFHRYFPLDINFLASKFIDSWKPDAVFFIDSEIWPNFLLKIKEQNIPVALINARVTKKTFRRWIFFPKVSKKIFSIFDFSLTSNKETNSYLEKLGAKNIFHYGNIKFCVKIDIEKIKDINDELLKAKKYWCAASTHNGEEEFCIKAHLALRENLKNLLTIIVPRHINRSKKIKEICDKYEISSQILNHNEKIIETKEIIIINSFGVLPKYFKYAKSAFIGKSMVKELEFDSGQNPIIAAKLGCKIYHGPFIYNFIEVYDFLNKNNISKKISSVQELSNSIIQDFKKDKKDNSKIIELMDNFGHETLDLTIKKIMSLIK